MSKTAFIVIAEVAVAKHGLDFSSIVNMEREIKK